MLMFFFFFFNDTATTEIYTLPYTTLFRSVRPTYGSDRQSTGPVVRPGHVEPREVRGARRRATGIRRAAEIRGRRAADLVLDRKSTRLNSSHLVISYAVFCLKKKQLHDAGH